MSRKVFVENASAGNRVDTLVIELNKHDNVCEMRTTCNPAGSGYLRFSKRKIESIIKYLQKLTEEFD